MALRATGGTLLVISFAMFTFNVLATMLRRKPADQPALGLSMSPQPTAAPGN
jgi:cbb3-type cytochrome oxidase subunit 1